MQTESGSDWLSYVEQPVWASQTYTVKPHISTQKALSRTKIKGPIYPNME